MVYYVPIFYACCWTHQRTGTKNNPTASNCRLLRIVPFFDPSPGTNQAKEDFLVLLPLVLFRDLESSLGQNNGRVRAQEILDFLVIMCGIRLDDVIRVHGGFQLVSRQLVNSIIP